MNEKEIFDKVNELAEAINKYKHERGNIVGSFFVQEVIDAIRKATGEYHCYDKNIYYCSECGKELFYTINETQMLIAEKILCEDCYHKLEGENE